MKNIDRKSWIMTGVAAVVILAVTALLRIPIVIGEVDAGYIHLGDIAVYAAAAVLGGPLGALAAAVGAALADLIVGAYAYIPAAIIFKAVLAFLIARMCKKSSAWADYIRPVVVCGIVTILGYFLYELLFRGFTVAAYGLPFNLIQAVVSALVGIPVLKLLNGKTGASAGEPVNVFPPEMKNNKRNLK